MKALKESKGQVGPLENVVIERCKSVCKVYMNRDAWTKTRISRKMSKLPVGI
jgi:hypothetical protein